MAGLTPAICARGRSANDEIRMYLTFMTSNPTDAHHVAQRALEITGKSVDPYGGKLTVEGTYGELLLMYEKLVAEPWPCRVLIQLEYFGGRT
jgi:hypothetical protein